MAEFPALPLWTDAYLGDTTHLTTTEHGAYLLLLMAMWRRDGTLPNDDKMLARYARLTAGQWKKMKPTLMEFFTVSNNEISQGRLADELNAVRQHSRKQSDKAKARWLKEKKTNNAEAMPNECRSDASLTLTQSHNTDTNVSRADAPDPSDLKAILFGECLQWFAGRGPKDNASARRIIGKWISRCGEGAVLEAFAIAQRNSAVDATAYIERLLNGKSKSRDAHKAQADAAAAAIAYFQSQNGPLAEDGAGDEGADQELPGRYGGMVKALQ